MSVCSIEWSKWIIQPHAPQYATCPQFSIGAKKCFASPAGTGRASHRWSLLVGHLPDKHISFFLERRPANQPLSGFTTTLTMMCELCCVGFVRCTLFCLHASETAACTLPEASNMAFVTLTPTSKHTQAAIPHTAHYKNLCTAEFGACTKPLLTTLTNLFFPTTQDQPLPLRPLVNINQLQLTCLASCTPPAPPPAYHLMASSLVTRCCTPTRARVRRRRATR
jgi:hypothetical protein